MSDYRIRLKTPEQLVQCRAAGQKAAEVLMAMCENAHAGMSTKALDDLALQTMHSLGCESADFGYYGYPAQTCISVNDAVIHGVPSDSIVLKNGDVLSIDITISYNGFIGDNARTVIVGGDEYAPPEVLALVRNTEAGLEAGIAKALAGNRVGDISHAIELVANAHHYGIVKEYVGHGCGVSMHEAPEIPNYGPAHRGPVLQEGMVLCIEPMFTLGSRRIKVLPDGWTVVTADHSPAAHAEKMIAITANGPEVLTDWH